jgi:hypothetical protein
LPAKATPFFLDEKRVEQETDLPEKKKKKGKELFSKKYSPLTALLVFRLHFSILNRA